ncbi:MAG: hypothetical protein RLY43_1453 [Bacteroidota bacterium]
MLFLLILVPLIWILRFKDYRFGCVAVTAFIIAINAGTSIFFAVIWTF